MSNPTDVLLRYRPWRGNLRSPIFASFAMAKFSLRVLLRRKLFWVLYALALMIFFFFFYGQYLIVWITTQTANQSVTFGALVVRVGELTKFLEQLNLNGSAHTFGNFIKFEGYIAMIVLALAGSILVGNDFHHRSLSFYLSKPIESRHYLLGKFMGIAAFVNLITTLPALLLFVQAGLLYDWQEYYLNNISLLCGILGYGLVLTLALALLLLATAVWVRRTVPLIMVWTGIFVLCSTLSTFLVEGQMLNPRWRLMDFWNDLYLVGLWLLQADRKEGRLGPQPEVWEAAIVVVVVCAGCVWYLRGRVRTLDAVG